MTSVIDKLTGNDNTNANWLELVGGSLLGAGGLKTVGDISSLESMASKWEDASRDTAEILKGRANTFVSPISGKKFKASPADFDLDHKIYYDNANKVLNKRLLGIKLGHLYDLPNQFSFALEQMQGVPKDHPVFFDGLLGTSKARSHNQFQMGKSRQESLAHFIRDYTLTKGKTRDLLFETKDVDTKIPKWLMNWAKEIQANPGEFKVIAPIDDGKISSLLKNMAYNSPKGLRLMLANSIASNGKVTELSPFLKSLGVTNENFSLQTVYDKLVDAAKNTKDVKAKKDIASNIKLLERMMLGQQWSGKFSNEMGPHYAKALGSLLKKLRPLKQGAGLVGLLGLGALGHGAYKLAQDS